MSLYRVYFDPTSGQIKGYDTGARPVLVDDDLIEYPLMREDVPFIVVEAEDIDAKRHVVDIGASELREMTDAERGAINTPSVTHLKAEREVELAATDWRELRGSDDWKTYRQALRDITGAGDPAAMIKAWPLRPDGSDAIAHLRPRG